MQANTGEGERGLLCRSALIRLALLLAGCLCRHWPSPGFSPRSQRMLDLEYEECIKATKGYNIEDYDQGPVGDEQQDEPPAPAAQAGGYAAFGGSAWRMSHSRRAAGEWGVM